MAQVEAGVVEIQPTSSSSNNTEATFEWLTNFRSIRHLVLPSRIIDQSSPPKNQLNALHVGCGTSTVGESLICLRERTHDGRLLQFGHVVNVDNDSNALDSMQHRWENRTQTSPPPTEDQVKWKCLDYSNDESCRLTMDVIYHQLMQQNNDAPTDDIPTGACFDLVLDKSTLDCLLCAETTVVAQFLCEVYRALRVPLPADTTTATETSSWGGIYVLITFHPVEFIQKLLQLLPGSDWNIEHEVIKREVDDVTKQNQATGTVYEVQPDRMEDSNTKDMPHPSASSAWSSGTFNPDENYRKTVTVFTCRRLCSQSLSSCDNNIPLHTHILDKEQVRKHIEAVCDEWYQTQNPMITGEREEHLHRAFFAEVAAAKINLNQDEIESHDKSNDSITDSTSIDLEKCYDILFTNAEKEHLSYEYFLEDWEAYCTRIVDGGHTAMDQNGMTFAIALDFLKEMQ